ncbi:DUF1853 family protein [Enterovibrio norvegicus]|uniref:DUF1853 family protein n=1 Tax=Enterovibrio norvegicus TaxID=188144 RepID=UPI00352BFCD1
MFSNPDQIERDIEWILNAPNVVSISNDIQVDDTFWQLQQRPHQLDYQGGRRIGFYYQWLIQSLLNAHPKYQIVEEELQVDENGRTLGAIDFIVKNASGELEHWEVAIKFYLAYHGEWHGPNAKDTLAKKYQKMMGHQLPLSQTDAFVSQFPHLNVSKRKLLVQGRLYVNPFLDKQKVENPHVEPDAISGYWCWAKQCPTEKRFFELERHQWMAAPQHSTLEPFIMRTPLQRAQHVVDEEGKHWFIVPDDWPTAHA